ncbi:sulfatase [Jiangella sp. DSM 45060]|uniref:sulfatase n=1 Tax=Jiangella sp. DSM 45060 TaxID=1798224 RepID=UPI00087B522D|nr:sulfatase [Jiangella sp. DSM 45060]SDT72296.1 Arylsulfatase A [Jiangella sp. DSM 45060]
MRAIMVMFDSLNRRFLPSYGADWHELPSFSRLERHAVTFDTAYGGSMPCMPARREMHTGRYNFLHRSWGPLEPFDDSAVQMLTDRGVHTHLTTDHYHYWQDGGATYHNRFSTFELHRGQEGDAWKGEVADPEIPETVSWRSGDRWRQDWVNRKHMPTEQTHSQTRTVDAGLEFLRTNAAEDRWYLQIECFDPHEPFFSYSEHKRRYPHEYDGAHFDWPDYRRVAEDPATVEHARMEYAALLSMCDDSLGRVLDLLDEQDMWGDTLLIVCTDHGLLLGERGWWGKNVQPWYDENIHLPLFVWDPRSGVAGERRSALVQTIDLGPTLLDFFGVEPTARMQGRSLLPVIDGNGGVRDIGMFGIFGGHACITDGRYVYMRASVDRDNAPLFEHTLMPSHSDHMFRPEELQAAELIGPLPFTQGVPVIRVPGRPVNSPFRFGTLLYDLDEDPGQQHPLRDDELELRMATLLVEAMRANDAPPSQYVRLGLPEQGAVTREHLLIAAQWEQVRASADQPVQSEQFATTSPVSATVDILLDLPGAADVIGDRLGVTVSPLFQRRYGRLTPLQLAYLLPGVSEADLRELESALAAIGTAAAPNGDLAVVDDASVDWTGQPHPGRSSRDLS